MAQLSCQNRLGNEKSDKLSGKTEGTMLSSASHLRLLEDMSETEKALRVDLAACYRLVALYGWDDLIFTHISARIPGPEHHFLINPYGMMFEEITASSLVKIDTNGNKVGESEYAVNPAGFTIHPPCTRHGKTRVV